MYRRSIASRFTLLTRRCRPFIAQPVLHDDDDEHHRLPYRIASKPQTNYFLGYGFYKNHTNTIAGISSLIQAGGGFVPSGNPGLGHFHSYSTSTVGDGSSKIRYVADVADVLVDKSVEVAAAQAPVASEVAVATADSHLPVAVLQYTIDGIHSIIGVNWWAAIALTTIIIRMATIPLLINQLKATSKLAALRPRMEEIKEQMLDSMDPKIVAEGQKQMSALFKEYGVKPYTPLKGLLIQGPVFLSFYFAITNMVEKVPSFKEGGAFWFTDLTTPDSLYIFPVFTSLLFLLTVELNAQEGMEGNPGAGTMKKFSRILAFLTVPFTMNFPKALFCYWITSNLFSLTYGLVVKRPPVRKFLALPEPPVERPKSASKPSPSISQQASTLFRRFNSLFGESKSASLVPSASTQQHKLLNQRVASSSVINQRIANPEKTTKRKRKARKSR